ncbi:HD domain-containing protein [Clostridium cylindrosporum]|uniref:Polynucleotide adenylyltransferase/metal dependent phosphohydrolase n=1 Tax=Clostridium cylindrosporum DSM 605 TaxID=1121307 RepID=A0A0J8DAP7_CLOCY|nr:HD domain-containing protein [Clostridium cylindrosporum]KMT23115.1 polynucleotide adenylyltransferase/metal dependent phosphohydrolase [Clostridium cylindrosporum DSM 605]
MRKLKLRIKNKLTLTEALRIIRFSAENQRSVNQGVIDIIKKSFNFNEKDYIYIKAEFELILLSHSVDHILRLLQEFRVLEKLIPGLSRCYGFNQRSKYHNKDVFEHIISVTSIVPRDITLRLCGILHDIAKPICFTMDSKGNGHFPNHDALSASMARDILKGFGYSEDVIDKVYLLVKNHMKKCKVASKENLIKLTNLVGKDNVIDLLELQIADDLSKNPEYVNVKPLVCLYKIQKNIN